MTETKSRGAVIIDGEECKGCGLCIVVCPVGCLTFALAFNHQGYHPVTYSGEGCRADGICFYACPEPGAITVLRLDSDDRREDQPAAP